jgi:heme-degrading monooxygenase HmoA
MATVLTILEVTPHREREWHQIWERARYLHEQQEGFRGGTLYCDTDEPGRYVILSEWDDRTHFNAFMRSMGTLWLDDALKYLARPATVMFLEESDADQAHPMAHMHP